MKNYVIACGGTGGHISPGIAVAEELTRRGNSCTLVVSNKNIDDKMLRKYPNLEHVVTFARPFSKNPIKFLKFFFSQIKALFAAISFLVQKKIDCVIGFGGFTNTPFILAGFLLRKKIVMHESNHVIGKSIRFLSFFADKIYLPDEVSFGLKFLDKKVQHLGYPLRREFVKLDNLEARKSLNINAGKMILVMGGSQGAKILTDWALQNYKLLNENDIFVYCLTGNVHFDAEKSCFREFSEDMCTLYNAADLVVSRAGAGTIAEAMFCGKPMILIPYKYAAGDHQTKNAQYVEGLSCAHWLPEEKIADLTELVFKCLKTDGFSVASGSAFVENPVFEIVDYVTK